MSFSILPRCFLAVTLFAIVLCPHAAFSQEKSALNLTSTAFANGAPIPAKYACTGSDKSPPLSWTGAPDGTRSYALIVDDPDAPNPGAPQRTWVHWVLYNLAATTTTLAEGAGNAAPGAPALAGINDWSHVGYGGPCPPVGRHRYFFKLYALDRQLPPLGPTTKSVLEKAMEGHILARAQFVGTFQK